ncbi:MAG: Uncharacterized protein G01um101416_219 [Microgenomates group bacterium Gr01-1014_16]|nr:MAG: Uncharacterized protein G01um101416_219 [Microgenomates group bacterium Gr01-1014_16]
MLAGVAVVSTVLVWMVVGMKTVYQNYDGPYYAAVAKCFYDKDCLGRSFDFPLKLEYYPAHFPLYPLLIRLIGVIGLIRAGVIINVLAAAAAAIVMYEVTGRKLWTGLVWLFFWPRMWAVRSIAGPETLFILFIVLSLYFYEKGKMGLSGLMGMLAVLTKSPGVLLFVSYLLNWNKKSWPVIIIPLGLLGVFGLFGITTGDFLAYFHSGDNIHVQALPFRVFDSSQPWVGTFWLEDILWIYLIGLIGVIRAIGKNKVFGVFGAVFYATILFVSHRDIARYSLPLVPVVLLGLSDVLEKKEVKWAMALLIIPMFFYTINFLLHNQLPISDWKPFF